MGDGRSPDLKRKCVYIVYGRQRRQSRNARPQSQREDYREVDSS